VTRNVLITGGCGFIGRHLASELLDAGYRVRLFDNLVEQVHGNGKRFSDDLVEHVFADVRDADALKRALSGVDDVVHLAAEVGVGQSMYEIARYVDTNDLGTAVLLEAMIDRPVERIVIASSMSVYGEGCYRTSDGTRVTNARRAPACKGWDPLDTDGKPLFPIPTAEDKPPDLASIYALTKFSQERAVLIFARAYRRRAVALRLFNVFGPGQALSNPYTGVLANFASRLANRQAPMIFEDGAQRRDFVHVKDVARAFRLALEQPEADGQVVNVGSGRSYEIAQIARLLAVAMGKPETEPSILNTARAGDIRHCFADISAARRLLGYEPRYRLEDSLDEFVAWVGRNTAVDRGAEMQTQLEQRGLVA
jgi:dTDP-L-rhamnose 4-epimerase